MKRLYYSLFILSCFFWSIHAPKIVAQQPNNGFPFGQGQRQQGNQANVGPGGNNGLGNGFGGNQGGGPNADFDSLIDLIQSTVAADTWEENGTGEGSIAPFGLNGVLIDTRVALRLASSSSVKLPAQRMPKAPPMAASPGEVRSSSALRFVSLPKLEAAIRNRQQQHEPLDAEMLTLAGLRRVKYVFVLPESGDLILAGPAGDWQTKGTRIVSVETGEPVLRLDDLLVLWRRRQTNRAQAFGCSINPRRESLAKTQEYIQATSAQPLEPGQRGRWLKGLRNALGKQDIEFFGVEADSHMAQVLLAADYHMKLIGMGLAEGVEGVESYLKSVRVLPDGSLPPMAVLRWWFAMRYDPVEVSDDRTVFRIRGPGWQVLSENELLAAQGRRVHTGKAEDLNRQFAESFNAASDRLSQAYPIYGELRNIFDLSLVLALIESEGLTERVDWQPTLFADARLLRLPQINLPSEIDTIVNHRVIRRKHIIAGVSGGVLVDAAQSLKVQVAKESAGHQRAVAARRNGPTATDGDAWWWDQ